MVKVPIDIYENKLVNTIEDFFIKLGRQVNHGERVNPIVLEVTGQR